MTNPENIRQIDRLTRFWPQANLTEDAIRAYGESVAGKDPGDVRTAVDWLITGKVERNHEYIPPPAQLAFQIGRARDQRLDEEARNKPRIAYQPTPSDTTPEQRSAIIEKLKAMNGGHLVKPMRLDIEAEKRRHREAQEKTILAALDGDQSAFAAWCAENRELGISPGRNAASA